MGVLSRIGIALDSDLLKRFACFEGLIVHGKSAQVKRFADRLIGLKGMQHGRLVMAVPANSLERCRKRGHENDHNR